ncbi:MAG: hypothetical protein K2G31_00795 [Clostridia bacterium]|nr:hypothetical protein [Clostridia bacterium]
MANADNRNKGRHVDESGIRLAPTPMRNAAYHVMPSIRQDFVIQPHIEIEEQEAEETRRETTENDFQPKTEDRSKKWKRRKRNKNVVIGSIMLFLTLVMVLPYILGVAGVWIENLSFRFVPRQFGALYNIVEAFKQTARLDWHGAEVGRIWIQTIPSIVLFVGIVFLAINMIKSVFAIFFAVNPVRYMASSVIYLLCVLAMFIASLVGASVIGIEKIDFIRDFIKGYHTSEMFSLVLFAVGYFIASLICTLINSDKYGYID